MFGVTKGDHTHKKVGFFIYFLGGRYYLFYFLVPSGIIAFKTGCVPGGGMVHIHAVVLSALEG